MLRRWANREVPVVLSNRTVGVDACRTMRPFVGRINPAMARRMVVFPLPDGPKRTVHGFVSSKAASNARAPWRCCIEKLRCGVRSDKFTPPEPASASRVNDDQGGQRNDYQHQS